MLDEVKKLQNNAVSKLMELIQTEREEITFKAPTGSGKTHMMADFMDRMLAINSEVVFIVSSLSKAELAKQNYDAFVKYIENGKFTHLNPYLIVSDDSSEGSVFIPTDYNVYVLPRDLYKDKSRLKEDAVLLKFLNEIKGFGAGSGAGKDIYVVKDECHQATNNLDELKNSFFSKIINFSATPKLSHGQHPDVEIRESDAIAARLIKKVEYGNETDSLEDALNKFVRIKDAYQKKSINVNPCLIIQISNKEKADGEIEEIKNLLSRHFSTLKWMLIVHKNGNAAAESDTNDSLGANKLPRGKWKDYAKSDTSTIDIIIFKMVITEGWDIRRACMLYQVRDTQSKQLDEQVIGRVRRNPRLLDFETLDGEEQELISTAYVWGIKPKESNSSYQVSLWGNSIQKELRVTTTRLKPFEVGRSLNLDTMNLVPVDPLTSPSIFELYKGVKQTTVEVNTLYKAWVDNYSKFFSFANNIDCIKKELNNICCDYSKYIEVTTDEANHVCEAVFPYQTSSAETDYRRNIDEWVWRRHNGDNDEFHFDSQAEEAWVQKLLSSTVKKWIRKIEVGDAEIVLIGKNFLENSEIKYEYYSFGRHFSYPDFIMKDKKERIHIFEVKSVNKSGLQGVDDEQYKEKIKTLKDFYREVSLKTKHYYHLPIQKGADWHIWTLYNGTEKNNTFDDFVALLK